MANSKQARKRVRQNERRNLRNRMARSSLRTEVKKFRQLLDEGDAAKTEKMLASVHSLINRIAKRGVIHDKTADRYKSRLARAHQSLAGTKT